MDTTTVSPLAICPGCHASVRPTDFFCFNCGKTLAAKPPSTSWGRQLAIYLGSLLLPPLGIIWGLQYLRQDDSKSKIVGWIAIALTLLSLFLAVKMTLDLVNTVNNVMNSQMQNLPVF